MSNFRIYGFFEKGLKLVYLMRHCLDFTDSTLSNQP